jgi:hypothetical protein
MDISQWSIPQNVVDGVMDLGGFRVGLAKRNSHDIEKGNLRATSSHHCRANCLSFIMGGISIIPYGTKLNNYSAHYAINEEFRLRIYPVLSGVIDDQHLKDLRFGIWLPLLLIILHIYNDFTRGLDSDDDGQSSLPNPCARSPVTVTWKPQTAQYIKWLIC